MPHIHLLTLSGYCWLGWAIYWFIAAWFVKRTKSAESWLLQLQHKLPLFLGFFLIFHGRPLVLLYGWLYDGHARPIAASGLALTVAGLLFSIWARNHLGKNWSGIITLKEQHELIRTGPYRFARHPIYTGFLLAALGSTLTAGTGDAIAGFLIILVALLIKMRREEKLLIREFGEQYLRFRQEVFALVPFVY